MQHLRFNIEQAFLTTWNTGERRSANRTVNWPVNQEQDGPSFGAALDQGRMTPMMTAEPAPPTITSASQQVRAAPQKHVHKSQDLSRECGSPLKTGTLHHHRNQTSYSSCLAPPPSLPSFLP